MIGQITGKLVYSEERYLILSASGVGYKIFSTPETMAILSKDEGQATVWTHLVVREDALDLYGFSSRQELDIFELLITVSGIGPKSALTILALAGMDTLRKAITTGNSEYLTKVAGIGKKSAEKIVLELRDKIGKLGTSLPSEELSVDEDVLNALQALGYSLREAREAVKKIPDNMTDTGEKIKIALKQLGK